MTLKRKLLTSAGLLVLSTGFALAAPAVVQSSVNLRAGPSVASPVITSMQAGVPVNVMGCGENWCRLAFGGTVGFADRDFLAPGGPVGPPSATVGSGYGYEAYGPGERNSYGATPGYAYGYGSTAYGNERGTYGNETRSDRVESRTQVNEPRTAAQIKGDNPMKSYNSTANPNRPRSGQQSAQIKGDNPMKNYKSTATSERTSNRAGETTGAAPNSRNGDAHRQNFIGSGPRYKDNHP